MPMIAARRRALATIEAALRGAVEDELRLLATELVLRDVEMDAADAALQQLTTDAEGILEHALQAARVLVADRLREDTSP